MNINDCFNIEVKVFLQINRQNLSYLLHLSPTILDSWESLELNLEILKNRAYPFDVVNRACPFDVVVISEVTPNLSFLLEGSPNNSHSWSVSVEAKP